MPCPGLPISSQISGLTRQENLQQVHAPALPGAGGQPLGKGERGQREQYRNERQPRHRATVSDGAIESVQVQERITEGGILIGYWDEADLAQARPHFKPRFASTNPIIKPTLDRLAPIIRPEEKPHA